MIEKSNINEVKKNIEGCIGQKVLLRGSLGRNKSFEKEGTLVNTYPNIFVVKYEENERNVSYQYKDVLTRTVEVDVFDGTGYSPLVPPAEKVKRERAVSV